MLLSSAPPAGAAGLSGGEESLVCKLRPGRRRRDLLDPGGERVSLPRRNEERQSLGTMAGFSALGLLFLGQLLATTPAQVRSLIYVLCSRRKSVREKDSDLCVFYLPAG